MNHKENIFARRALSYFIADEMRFNSNKFLNRIGDLSEEYIEQISEYIDEYLINTNVSQEFLDKAKRYDILKKFIRR